MTIETQAATIEMAFRYPLTGARHEELGFEGLPIVMNRDGLLGDRGLVLFDPDTRERVRTKIKGGSTDIHRIGAEFVSEGLVRVTFYDEKGLEPITQLDLGEPDGANNEVFEFEDTTPVIEFEPQISDIFSEFLDKTVILGKKDYESVSTDPKERAVAPLHIVSRSSLDFVSERIGLTAEVLAQRFRANLVLNADDSEFDWTNWSRIRLFANAWINITKTTKRCEVPSQDQLTGENRKDVAKVNRSLPRRDGKEVYGVYGFLNVSKESAIGVKIGEEVEIESVRF